MKVYVDFKDLDAEDMPSNISNKYNLQVRSLNSGSDYKNIEIVSLAEYDKQVRKEIIEQVKDYMENHSHTIPVDTKNRKVVYKIGLTRFLDQIQGE